MIAEKVKVATWMVGRPGPAGPWATSLYFNPQGHHNSLQQLSGGNGGRRLWGSFFLGGGFFDHVPSQDQHADGLS